MRWTSLQHVLEAVRALRTHAALEFLHAQQGPSEERLRGREVGVGVAQRCAGAIDAQAGGRHARTPIAHQQVSVVATSMQKSARLCEHQQHDGASWQHTWSALYIKKHKKRMFDTEALAGLRRKCLPSRLHSSCASWTPPSSRQQGRWPAHMHLAPSQRSRLSAPEAVGMRRRATLPRPGNVSAQDLAWTRGRYPATLPHTHGSACWCLSRDKIKERRKNGSKKNPGGLVFECPSPKGAKEPRFCENNKGRSTTILKKLGGLALVRVSKGRETV